MIDATSVLGGRAPVTLQDPEMDGIQEAAGDEPSSDAMLVLAKIARWNMEI